ncbi:MAG: hypothetical protein KKD31_00525, partial [Bacteroidetes bacterium]|nr:hypothetical protein [Bacteroidota bacterium]
MKKTILLLALCLCGSAMLRAQTTIVNCDFNNGSSYATLTPELAAGITAEITCTEGFQTYSGTEPGGDAFSSGSNAGTAVGMANSSGTKTRYWTLHLSGTALTYCDNFKFYIQAQRTNDGARSVELAYSTDGVSFTEPGMTMAPGNNSFKEHVFDLSGISLLSGQQDI